MRLDGYSACLALGLLLSTTNNNNHKEKAKLSNLEGNFYPGGRWSPTKGLSEIKCSFHPVWACLAQRGQHEWQEIRDGPPARIPRTSR